MNLYTSRGDGNCSNSLSLISEYPWYEPLYLERGRKLATCDKPQADFIVIWTFIPREGTETVSEFEALWSVTTDINLFTSRGDGNSSAMALCPKSPDINLFTSRGDGNLYHDKRHVFYGLDINLFTSRGDGNFSIEVSPFLNFCDINLFTSRGDGNEPFANTFCCAFAI